MNSFATPRKRQRGVVVLATAVILMLAVFGISYFMSETVIKDKQLASNAIRANEAFQNAHNGLDYTVAYIEDQTLDVVFDNSAAADLILNDDPDGVDVLPFTNVEVTIANKTDYFEIVSVGYSADLQVQRTIRTWISAVPADPEPPNVPVVAKGSAYLSGDLDVYNNEEPLTIWTGETLDSSGNAQTFISIDGKENQLSSSKTTRGPDIVDSDKNLADATEDELLQSFFNRANMEAFEAESEVVLKNGDDWSDLSSDDETYLSTLEDDFTKRVYFEPPTTADDALGCDQNGLSWYQLDLTDIDTSPESPARVVVNGNVRILGGGNASTFYGVVIAKKIRIQSGFNWEGGVVATDCIDTGNGGVRFELNKTVMEKTPLEPKQVYVRGSWRDW